MGQSRKFTPRGVQNKVTPPTTGPVAGFQDDKGREGAVPLVGPTTGGSLSRQGVAPLVGPADQRFKGVKGK